VDIIVAILEMQHRELAILEMQHRELAILEMQHRELAILDTHEFFSGLLLEDSMQSSPLRAWVNWRKYWPPSRLGIGVMYENIL
jgi:hypothetical protein